MGGEAHCEPRVRKGLMGDRAFPGLGNGQVVTEQTGRGRHSVPGKTPGPRVGWDFLTATESAYRAVWVMKLSSVQLGTAVGVH